VGENPPNEAVVQFYLKQRVPDLKLRITNGAGKTIREVAMAGQQSNGAIGNLCWDLRGEPITVPSTDSAAGRGGRGGAGGAGGRGGRGAATPAVPGVPGPVPTPLGAVNPCAAPGDTTGNPARGGGNNGGGGIGGPAPLVMPGTYTVALTSGGKVLDSKPMKIVFDPDVHFAAGEHEKYNALATDLHELQRRGVAAATALNSLYPQMADVTKKVSENSNVPANVKSQLESLSKAVDSVRKKFGVPIPVATGGRGGGGGRGAAPDPENVLARETALKNQLMGVWEAPSASLVRQANAAKVDLPKAIGEANAVLTRASTASTALAKYNITLTVPPTVK
jgi:hypothetical protein